MKLWRSVWMSILLYAISFIIGLGIAVLIGFDMTAGSEPPESLWIYGIGITIILVGVFTFWYLRSQDVKESWQEGLCFGIVMIVVSFIIEGILIIPMMIATSTLGDIVAYYLNPLFWLNLVLVLATSTLVGYYKGENKEKVIYEEEPMPHDETPMREVTEEVVVKKATKKSTKKTKKVAKKKVTKRKTAKKAKK